MSHVHQFIRPEQEGDSRRVGEVYSPEHRHYEEGARYAYANGAHDLVLFWKRPTPAEVIGVRDAPVEVGLYTQPPAAFLLYKIQNVCEWSDVAFHVQLLGPEHRQLPDEPTGERGRLRITLVDAEDGVIKAKRLVSLEKVTTQALRHVMREQAQATFVRALYEIAVQEAHARFPDTDAMAQAAEVIEPTHG